MVDITYYKKVVHAPLRLKMYQHQIIIIIFLYFDRMKDGRVIPAGSRYHMIQEGDTCYLKIDNVSISDNNNYFLIL